MARQNGGGKKTKIILKKSQLALKEAVILFLYKKF
jgi:hypothetical protein